MGLWFALNLLLRAWIVSLFDGVVIEDAFLYGVNQYL